MITWMLFATIYALRLLDGYVQCLQRFRYFLFLFLCLRTTFFRFLFDIAIYLLFPLLNSIARELSLRIAILRRMCFDGHRGFGVSSVQTSGARTAKKYHSTDVLRAHDMNVY